MPCVVLVALLYLVAMTPRTLLVGGICLGVALVGVLIGCAVASPGSTPVDDVAGNYCILALLAIASSLVVFVLGRTRVGTVALLLLGLVACAFVEYLYWTSQDVAFVVFVVAAIGLVVFRNYQVSLIDSESDQISFTSVSLTGIVLGGVSLAVAAVVFMLVIAPLNPGNITVKLFTEYRSSQVIELSGAQSAEHVQGELASDNTVEGDEDTSDSDEQQEVKPTTISSLLGVSDELSGDGGATIGLMNVNLLFLIIPLLIVLLVVGVIVLRRALRRRRYRTMTSGDNEDAVMNLYLFFVERFKRLKIECPTGQTIIEFSRDARSTFQAFERSYGDGPCVFEGLTDAYSRVVYGGLPASDEDRELFERYYATFYKNVIHHVGRLKYLLMFFRV